MPPDVNLVCKITERSEVTNNMLTYGVSVVRHPVLPHHELTRLTKAASAAFNITALDLA